MSQDEVAQTRSSVKKVNADLLSNLPEDVRLKILECLPLQDAVRTSILSTYWRHKWTKLLHIKLDKEFFSTIVEQRVENSDISMTYSNIVNNVLHCHVGSLRKFVLYLPLCLIEGQMGTICEWLQFVSRKNVSELRLIHDQCNIDELASTVFFYVGLTHLTLHDCAILTLPSTFTGFTNLVSLELLRCDWSSEKILESLISSSPQLRLLRLENLEVNSLTIHAPKLEHLFLDGFLRKLCLGNETTKIRTFHLDFSSDTRVNLVCSSLPGLQSLRLGPNIFVYLWRYGDKGLIDVLERLETQTLELIGIPLYSPFINYLALKLVSSSQVVQRLYCKVADYDFSRYGIPPQMSSHILLNIGKRNLSSLKYVELVCVLGSDTEQQFMKVILECSPRLEVMTIELSDKVKEAELKLNIAMQSMQLSRASRNAQIIFKN